MMCERFAKQGIHFYITEHMSSVNEQMRQLGIGWMIEKGHVRRTITAALHDSGYLEPYTLKGYTVQKNGHIINISAETENTLEEFAWAFGDETVDQIEKRVHQVLDSIHCMPDWEEIAKQGIESSLKYWHGLGAIDEDEFLRRMEIHMDELPDKMADKDHRRIILGLLEKRRHHIREEIGREHPEILEKLQRRREKLEQRLEKQNPEGARRLHQWEQELRQKREESS